MPEDHEYLEILKANVGFEAAPQRWVPYARRQAFRRVGAEKLRSCPDCDGQDVAPIGQYVYYSTLCRLCRCRGCDLVFSDTRLDPTVIAQHFERHYKDESYFSRQRKTVIDQVASIIDTCAGHKASVLDIGGAKGHLMAALRARRPDLDLTVNDLSGDACDHARRHFGLRTISGPLSALQDSGVQYDVIALIDVMYYEPDLKALWAVISRRLKTGGVAVIRIPNRSWIVRTSERAKDLCLSTHRRSMTARISFFNPEHLYVLSRRYLQRPFAQLGFADARFEPARLIAPAPSTRLGCSLFFALAAGIAAFSGGRIVLTPSQLITVTKQISPVSTTASGQSDGRFATPMTL